MQKRLSVQLAALTQRPPELQAALEGGIDRHRLGRGHRAVRLPRRVVQLAIRGMAGAGVVHRPTALKRRGLQPLHQQQPKPRIQLMQQGRQGGAHDAGAHEHRVEAVGGEERTVVLHRCQGWKPLSSPYGAAP